MSALGRRWYIANDKTPPKTITMKKVALPMREPLMTSAITIKIKQSRIIIFWLKILDSRRPNLTF
jgi:hypothetical protein